MARRMGWLGATARKFKRCERGGVLPFVGLSLTVILGFAALAIDLTHQSALRSQLQATADAAALAAASQLPNEKKARERAMEYAETNMPPTEHGTVLRDDDIVFGTWLAVTRQFVAGGPVTNAVQVTVRRSVENGNAAPTFFMRIFGKDNADLTGASLAGRVLFKKMPNGGIENWSDEDRARFEEMRSALSEEAQYRWKKSYGDLDEMMTDKEAVEFLLEQYGKPALLR